MALTTHPQSHLDHNLSPEHIEWLLKEFADKTGFFIATVTLPDHLASVPCGLFGPVMGDDPIPESLVHYGVRGANRRCATRLIDAAPRMTRQLTIVAGPIDDVPCALYTSYGGPAAPREPGDLTITTWEQVVESRAFWAEHALTTHPF